jgi:hypothetical protein
MASRPSIPAARSALILLMLLPVGGCIRAERTHFERHLTTVIAPSPMRFRTAVALGARGEDDRKADERLNDARGGHSPP